MIDPPRPITSSQPYIFQLVYFSPHDQQPTQDYLQTAHQLLSMTLNRMMVPSISLWSLPCLGTYPCHHNQRSLKYVRMYLNKYGSETCIHAPLFLIVPTAYPSSIPPPTDVSVIRLTPTSAQITWTPPEGVTPAIYIICFVPIEADGVKEIEFPEGTEISYTENDLNDGTTYVVLVIARGRTASVADPVVFTSGILKYSLGKISSHACTLILYCVHGQASKSSFCNIIKHKWERRLRKCCTVGPT